MQEWAIRVLIIIVAVIHLLPLAGAISAGKITALYGVDVADPNLEILMRHRAVLFGLLGIFFAYAAFKPGLLPIAFIAAFISVSSFFWLAFSVGDYNPALRKVVIADVIAAAALVSAVTLYFFKP